MSLNITKNIIKISLDTLFILLVALQSFEDLVIQLNPLAFKAMNLLIPIQNFPVPMNLLMNN